MEKLESKTIVVKVKGLVPYARNPRRNDQAVETLKKSLMDFGYVSRIVVAEDMTITVDREVARFYKDFFDNLQPFNDGFEDWTLWSG